MEVLEQLEIRVADLLARLDALRAECAQATSSLAAAVQQRQALEQENSRLTQAVARSEERRKEALRRLDALLRKIQEHDSVE